MPACRHAAAARPAEAFTAIACTGPASRPGPPGRPRPLLPRHPPGAAGERKPRYVRPVGTAGGTSQHSLDGHLIPEGTSKCLLISPPRWFQGPEHARPRHLPAGPVRAAVPGHRRNRGDLLPVHPRDHQVCPVHGARRGHRRGLLYAQHRPDAGHWHRERPRSPLIRFWQKRAAPVDLPTYTNIWRIEKRLYKLYDFRLPRRCLSPGLAFLSELQFRTYFSSL